MQIKKITYAIIFSLNILSSFVYQINGQLIVPLKKNLNSYYIKVFYDENKKESEYVKINMALDFTFIPLPQLKVCKIESENEIIEIDNKEYNTKLISCNNFYLENNNNINLDQFNFYSISKTEINKDKNNNQYFTKYADLFFGQFGLSPQYEADNMNILSILKQKQLIKKMSFGFSFNYKQANNDILFLGQIEQDNKNDLIQNKNTKASIDMNQKLIKKYNKWGFKLDGIVIQKPSGFTKNIKHKYFAYFNLIEDRIFVPDKFMEYLISRIFNTYIKSKVCFVSEYSDKKFINCYKDKILKEKSVFPNIIFVVDNLSFKLTYDDLFINSINNKEVIFIIQKNYYDIDTSIILFGSRFIKKYMTEFDLEEKKIIFYSENNFPNINLAQIEDDSWKDMIRDYNKEIEHYDSNYGNEEEEKDYNGKSDINEKENEGSDNSDEIKRDDRKNISVIRNENDRSENEEYIDYSFYIKYFLAIVIIIFIIIGVFILFKVRKKIRINKEKDYFKQPFNGEKNEE